ncbi:G protein-coupled glucose receptor regulating Gpa2-domain-containing protein [Rhexocercosporidium sp. MPI-PUGE-AT-0058]|nr:G protein-coupled glucose receptor regulating Gpa2-domain-containing protein [Rhexocercosporidium sp. MPI-PUGE-AT-0058]
MAVLSAPSSPHDIHVLSLVIFVVSVLSVLGAGWIIVSFLLFKSLRTFRHQLILGLAISDFWMAINFLSSASMNISGSNIGSPREKNFCSFNGFMIQVFVVQTDYWVLSIATCTYLILASHKTQSSWVQDHKLVIWIIPWFLSLLWAAIGLAVVGYGNIGAWCWFTSDRVRLLVNFLPRWLIIITILALYIRLYFIIRKAHTRFMSFDEDDVVGSLSLGLQTESYSSRLRNGSEGGKGELSGHQGVEMRGPVEGSGSVSVSGEGDGNCERGFRNHPTTVTTTHTRMGRPSPVLKRISYQMMTYPLVYILIWTIPTTIRIYQATTNEAAPFAIGTIDKSCIVIQGFADAIVYGFNESTWRLWRDFFSRSEGRN